MTANVEIPDLLITKGLTFGDAFSPSIRVIQQGFTELAIDIKDDQYIELNYVPNDTVDLAVANDTSRMYQGLFVATFVMAAGQGIIAPITSAELLADQMPKGTVLYGTDFKLIIYRKPIIRGPIKDGKWWRVPVSIPYKAIAR